MLKVLGDRESLGCYRLVAERCPPGLIYQALALVKEAARNGAIRKSKGALFVDIIKRLAKANGVDLPLGQDASIRPGKRMRFLAGRRAPP